MRMVGRLIYIREAKVKYMNNFFFKLGPGKGGGSSLNGFLDVNSNKSFYDGSSLSQVTLQHAHAHSQLEVFRPCFFYFDGFPKSEPALCPAWECGGRRWSGWSELYINNGHGAARFCRDDQCVIMETRRRDRDNNEDTSFVRERC